MRSKKFMKKRIAIGVITNYINTLSPYLEFLNNAQRSGHVVTDMIIVYSHIANKLLTDRINEEVNLHLVKLNSDQNFVRELSNIGLTTNDIKTLFYSENFT